MQDETYRSQVGDAKSRPFCPAWIAKARPRDRRAKRGTPQAAAGAVGMIIFRQFPY